MKDAGHEGMDAAIAAVYERMRPTILARFEAIEEGLAAACEAGVPDDLREHALQEAHRLAGSLGMFGFPHGTALAREIEGAFRRGLAHDKAARYAERLRGLKAELEA